MLPNDPYIPQPVPDSGNPELERYLAEEMDRLSQTVLQIINNDVVQAYGGLFISSAQTGTVGTTAAPITTWDGVRPDLGPVGVTPDPTTGEIAADSGGIYFLSFSLSVDIASNRTYVITLYFNGVPTSVATAIASNDQASNITLVAMESAQPGDDVSIYVEADQANSQFDILRAEFSVFRVSEVL